MEDPDPAPSRLPAMVVLFVAEAVGTFILVCFGCMGVSLSLINYLPGHALTPGICFGLSVMVALNVVHHISGGHVNPQITIAAVVLGKMKLILVPVYFLGQFVGAVLGMGMVKLLRKNIEGLCVTVPNTLFASVGQALAIETTFTFFLILIFGAVMDPRNANKIDSLPLRFGLSVGILVMIAAPFTGGSMNSARSFAPALINWIWTDHWIYWVGPTIGSIVGAAFYRWVLEPPFN